MATTWRFELAAWVPEDKSTSVAFVGMFDQGRRITFVRRDGQVAYTYEIPSDKAIMPPDFHDALKGSIGRYWGDIKKLSNDNFTKDETFADTDITASRWVEFNGDNTALQQTLAEMGWSIGGSGLFAF